MENKKDSPNQPYVTEASRKNLTLAEKLKNYTAGGAVPFHMPGHKRNGGFSFLQNIGLNCDITEIDGFDDLNDASERDGVIKDSEKRAAELYGSAAARYLVNGSTAGVLAAFGAFTSRGDKVLIARNCHKSVYNAVELFGLRAEYLVPKIEPDFGFFGSVEPQTVEEAFKENPEIKLVVITSPTYDGIVSDVENIAKVIHSHGAKLFVDSAHGAHLGFVPYQPLNAATLGADAVAESLHKTLPCFTQTAILLINDKERVNAIDEKLSVFQTSSPSYIFLSTIDGLIGFLENKAQQIFDNFYKRLFNTYKVCGKLSNLQLFGNPDGASPQSVFAFDDTKILVRDKSGELSGIEIQNVLRDGFNIEIEMASDAYALLISSIGDTDESLNKLTEALISIDKKISELPPQTNVVRRYDEYILPERRLYPWECAHREFVPVSDAYGRVAAENIYAYPPGCPIIAKGERIFKSTIDRLVFDRKNGINVMSSLGKFPEEIAVVRQ